MGLTVLEAWVVSDSSPSDGRCTWGEVQVSSGHSTHLNDTDPELRGELETSGTQLLNRLMRVARTASYLYCIYLYACIFPLEH